jgi:hypothetical protein
MLYEEKTMKKKERKENRCVVGAVSRSPRIVALRWQSLEDPSVRPFKLVIKTLNEAQIVWAISL